MSLRIVIGGVLVACAASTGCANVRCPAGTTCFENKRGRVSCKADCETSCGNIVPHLWNGLDDGSNCCNECTCRNGHMQCEEKACGDSCTDCSYDCTTKEIWSDKKKEWCCEHEMLGCPAVPLALGETCYQFCEDSSCDFIDKRDQCEKGECIAAPGIGFNSFSTCQLPAGATCYQFCEDGSCAPLSEGEHCTAGTECKSDGTIGFNSHHTCQNVLAAGEVCYQFCEDGSCEPVDKRDECQKGTECKSDGSIGFNSRHTCQAI
eukprot:TRINITY_DN1664_c0_g1_i4.p2 TRINITY_DN1664_c0_g1~~TRINITY_DN1664_c0_g1_i4.p2  ORF type:complete len:263 (+),score=64.92 TRINITY_DN1664_c0_g1_i4:65-853(+)